MRTAISAVFAVILSPLAWPAAAQQPARTWDFEKATVGQLPEGWSAAKTGEGPGSVWKIEEDATSTAGRKVLVQTSAEGPKRLYNLCVADDSRYGDLDLSVSLKSLRGTIDRGGGPVWHYQDAKNYYVARVNPLETNFRVYKLVDGKRTQLASADVDEVMKKWQTIRIVHRGPSIQCYIDGQLLMEAKDDAIRSPGKIGLWTKADAVTAFDNVKVAP
jgi:hypothetical protein